MKTIKTNALISSFRGLSDGSLSLTLHTPELTSSEKAEFMNLQNVNLEATFQPTDMKVPDLKIDKDVDKKSQAERIRAIIFILWKQGGEEGEFYDFYQKKTEKIINYLKEQINENQY